MLREEYFKILRSIHIEFNSFLSVNDIPIGKEKKLSESGNKFQKS